MRRSFCQPIALPEINGSLEVAKAGTLGVNLDGFPSFELYHRRRAGASPSCVFRFKESVGFALVMPEFIPGFSEGGSKC
jgi:hypothetical protein